MIRIGTGLRVRAHSRFDALFVAKADELPETRRTTRQFNSVVTIPPALDGAPRDAALFGNVQRPTASITITRFLHLLTLNATFDLACGARVSIVASRNRFDTPGSELAAHAATANEDEWAEALVLEAVAKIVDLFAAHKVTFEGAEAIEISTQADDPFVCATVSTDKYKTVNYSETYGEALAAAVAAMTELLYLQKQPVPADNTKEVWREFVRAHIQSDAEEQQCGCGKDHLCVPA